jgi:hypothetical protein
MPRLCAALRFGARSARLRVPHLRLAVLTGGDAREDRCVRVRYEPSLVSFSYSNPCVGIEPNR